MLFVSAAGNAEPCGVSCTQRIFRGKIVNDVGAGVPLALGKVLARRNIRQPLK